MVKAAVAPHICPRSVHVTIPVPPLPLDSMYHDLPTLSPLKIACDSS
jgi:hypothetical protein